MTRTLRLISLFITQAEIEEIEELTGQKVDKALRGAMEFLLYYKIVKRCEKCSKEIQLLIPKDQSRCSQYVEHVQNPTCDHCNPQSKWRRVEDVE